MGGHAPRHHPEQVQHSSPPKATGDAKRRTVQVEYVEPKSQTKRGSAVDADLQPEAQQQEEEDAAPPPIPKAKPMRPDTGMTRAATTAGIEGSRNIGKYADGQKGKGPATEEQRLPGPAKGKTRPVSFQYQQSTNASRAGAREGGGVTDGPTSAAPSRRPSKDHSGTSGPLKPEPGAARPSTANSLGSTRLPSRGSYSQPLAPSLAANTAEGKIQMPKSGKPYNISNPIPNPEAADAFDRLGSTAARPAVQAAKGHKRANTVTGTSSSDAGKFLNKFMGGTNSANSTSERPEAASRPVMTGASDARQSLDQGGRPKGDKSGGQKGRRFSLLPQSFSLGRISGGGSNAEHSPSKHERRMSRTSSKHYSQQQHPQVASQPQLLVPQTNDADSALTASDTSLAARSAPTSAYDREGSVERPAAPEKQRTTLKKHKKFGDAFDGDMGAGGHGSSGPARRVMDFFRRRGVVRSKGA